jgi:hypothetical protein
VSEQDGSSRLASSVVAELLRRGVTDLVLAPGSRSAPVAFAAHDARRRFVVCTLIETSGVCPFFEIFPATVCVEMPPRRGSCVNIAGLLSGRLSCKPVVASILFWKNP